MATWLSTILLRFWQLRSNKVAAHREPSLGRVGSGTFQDDFGAIKSSGEVQIGRGE